MLSVTASPAPITLNAPGLLEASLDDLQLGLEELDRNQEPYRRARQYYEGNNPEVFASTRLRRAMARAGMNFRFNFAKTPVEAVTERLEISAVRAEDEHTTEQLQALWDANELGLEALDIHSKAGMFGDCYVIVWPTQEYEEDGQADPQPDQIEIHYNSPENCRVFYDPEHPRVIRYAIKRWELPRTGPDRKCPVRADLYYPDRIERYITSTGKLGNNARDFVPYRPPADGAESEWPLSNPYGMPVFHFRNARPYGRPEHYGFYGPQDTVNKLIVSHMSGVDYQSFPQRYALMAAEHNTSEVADLDEDEFMFGPRDTDTRTDTDATSTFSSDPGSLWFMRGVTGVGQFAVASPNVFLEPTITYIKSGAQITGTPLHYFDVAGQVPSGESLRAAEAPFNKKVRHRQLSYGTTWKAVFIFALRLLGIDDPKVTITWAPSHTVDDSSGWETASLKLAAGVPPKQVFMEAGYTNDEVESWATKIDLDTLVQLATALVSLGQAVGLGVIDQPAARDLVNRVLPGTDLLPAVSKSEPVAQQPAAQDGTPAQVSIQPTGKAQK